MIGAVSLSPVIVYSICAPSVVEVITKSCTSVYVASAVKLNVGVAHLVSASYPTNLKSSYRPFCACFALSEFSTLNVNDVTPSDTVKSAVQTPLLLVGLETVTPVVDVVTLANLASVLLLLNVNVIFPDNPFKSETVT